MMSNSQNKIISYKAAVYLAAERNETTTIVVKTGCFDIVHVGHLLMLEDAKKYGHILIVGIGSDDTVKKERPYTYFDEINRARMIAGLDCVDFVVILREQSHGNVDHTEFLRQVAPDFFHVSTDDKNLQSKQVLAKSIGAEMILKDPVKIMNYGQSVEPHSSNFKK